MHSGGTLLNSKMIHNIGAIAFQEQTLCMLNYPSSATLLQISLSIGYLSERVFELWYYPVRTMD